jgi:cell division protein FtsW
MKRFFSRFEGDKTIWALIVLLMLFSFMPVFSASTNLVHVVGTGGSTIGLLMKHFSHILIGLGIVYFVHKIPQKRIQFASTMAWVPVFFLLIITLIQKSMIGGANASRWLKIPIINITFQPSSIGWISIILYLSWYLWWSEDKNHSFKLSSAYIWVPTMAIVGLVLPANLSTAAMILFMCGLVLFVGKYPIKYLARIGAGFIAMIAIVFLLAKAFPEITPSRFSTWVARIDRFGAEGEDIDRWQIDNAKIAIAQGELFGVGPGKSVQKNLLPQSSSDFIFAIIVEEYGFVGGFSIVMVYMILLFRFLKVSARAKTSFQKYMVFGLGFSIVFQALINVGVAVELFPTTGQPLPLISSGGTSIWMTCLSLGLILGVSRSEKENREQEIANEIKKEEFRKLLEEQEKEREASGDSSNPLSVLLNK